jgi:hypothetical protein
VRERKSCSIVTEQGPAQLNKHHKLRLEHLTERVSPWGAYGGVSSRTICLPSLARLFDE